MKKLPIIVVFALLTGSAVCQGRTEFVREKDVYFGLTGGSLLANKHTATRYDGSDFEYPQRYDLEFLLSFPQIRAEIASNLGVQSNEFRVASDGYPEPLKYRPSVSLGGVFGYYFSEPAAFFVEGVISRISISNAIVLEIDNPSSTLTEPRREICPLLGREDRFDLTVGLHYDFTYGEQLMFYTEFGAMLNSVRPRSNSVFISGKEYVFTRNNQNTNLLNITNMHPDPGGIGFGGKLGLGFRYKFNEKFTFDLGGDLFYLRINLGPEDWQKFKPQWMFYIRALWL